MALTRVRGSAWDTQDNLVVDILTDLNTVHAEGIIFVSGGSTANDGNGGWFKYETLEPRSNHDGFDIIDPSGTTAGRGCWVRQHYATDPPGHNTSEVQRATTGQTDFVLQNIMYSVGTGSLSVYVNGTRLTPFSYTEVDATHVTIGIPLRNNDVVEFLHHENPTGGGQLTLDADQVRFENLNSSLAASDVQSAIEELDATLQMGGGGGGAPGTGHTGPVLASRVQYLPVAPDVSATSQANAHWLQRQLFSHVNDLNAAHTAGSISFDPMRTGMLTVSNIQDAIDEMYQEIGIGHAFDIDFDNTLAPSFRRTVQGALVDAYNEIRINEGRISAHIHDRTDAHKASAISLISSDPRFTTTDNVHAALDTLSHDLRVQRHPATDIDFDQSKYRLGLTVQTAIESVQTNHLNHVNDPDAAHAATAISFTPAQNLTSITVQDVSEELQINLNTHINKLTNVHMASAIGFDPINNPLKASNVETAILEAMRHGTQIYLGGTDLTVAYPGPPAHISNNDYYTVERDGTLGTGWPIANRTDGDTVRAGDRIIWEETSYWYEPMYAGGVVVQDPLPGNSQHVHASDINDNALVLQGEPNHIADLLWVKGNGQFDGMVMDDQGNLRQVASTVVFNDLNVSYTAATVQTALQSADDLYTKHLSAYDSTYKHFSADIKFVPQGVITSSNVQDAINAVSANTQNHINSTNAHVAANLTFDDSNSNLNVNNIQAAVDSVYLLQDNHAKQATAAHAASAITYSNAATTLTSQEAQGALDELFDLTNFDTIDGGSF